MLKNLSIFSLIVSFCLCITSPSHAASGADKATVKTTEVAGASGMAPMPSVNSRPFPLFFVTNRSQKRNDAAKFSDVRSDELTYGEYLRNQETEKTSQAKLVLFRSQREFTDAVKAAGAKKVAVFVHGYRKSFEGSMDFGLQMSKHLDAPLIVFAWPSKNNYCAYMADECTAEWSSTPLATFLGDLGQNFGYHNIALVSHSLGARMVQWALKTLYAERRPADQFAAALFFSPDVDRDTFLHDAHFLVQACSNCRVFLDNHDSRIWISKVLHGSPRVGSKDKENSEISQIMKYDTSLPSHQIPFDLVAETVHQIAAGDTPHHN